jgi:hypothetical protein
MNRQIIRYVTSILVAVIVIIALIKLCGYMYQKDLSKCQTDNVDIESSDSKYDIAIDDLTVTDIEYLEKLAVLIEPRYGNLSVLDKSKIMSVSINRSINELYPNNIQAVCVEAAEEYGFSQSALEECNIDKNTKTTLDNLIVYGVDFANGSCNYDEVIK